MFNALFDLIAIPLGWILRFRYNRVGNYGIALVLFTLITKLLLLPLSIKQKKSTIRMSAFQPEIQRIQKKYANNQQKMAEEMQRLQTEHNFSMYSSCLPMLVQFPILFGLIRVIYEPMVHITGVSKSMIETLKPIAEGVVGALDKYTPQTSIISAIKTAPEKFASLLDAETITAVSNLDLTFLGMDLTATPNIKVFNTLLIIPVLTVASMLVQTWLTQKLSGQQTNGSTNTMMAVSTLMMGYFAFIMPAGVSIYWIFSGVFGIAQELLLSKFYNLEKEKEKIQREIEEARRKRKEEAKKRPEREAKAKASPKARDKYVEDTYENAEEAEKIRLRLEKARAQDREKYGE